ncbi:MAG: response regulator, partial [Opitutaceae bacterium]
MPSPPKPPHLLVVDDDEGLLILMGEALRTAGYATEIATSTKAARVWLADHRPDMLILDLKLRDGNGPALVAELQRAQARVPFIVVTGQGDEKVAVEVMKQGALDYVIKDTRLLDALPVAVQRA